MSSTTAYNGSRLHCKSPLLNQDSYPLGVRLVYGWVHFLTVYGWVRSLTVNGWVWSILLSFVIDTSSTNKFKGTGYEEINFVDESVSAI